MYVGIDAHKRMCHATVLSEDGTVVEEIPFPTNVKFLETWARTLPRDSKVAIESSTISKRLARVLIGIGLEVQMAHPLEVRRMGGKKKKTDKEDSALLADLLRMGRLPESYLPTLEEEDRRQILRLRMDLGRKTAVVKNQVHSLLASLGVPTDGYTDLFGKGGRRMLAELELDLQHRFILDMYLQQLDVLVAQIKEVQGVLARMASEDPAARRLMQIKGVDFYSALVILAEVGDVSRFPTAKHLTSYAGLVPRVHQSGNVARTGRIHKEGPKRLRSTMISCANASIKGPGKFQRMYKRLKKRDKSHGKAIVAVARKMLEVVFVLLTRECDYEDSDEVTTARKVRKMERISSEMRDVDVAATIDGLSEKAREILRGDDNNTLTG